MIHYHQSHYQNGKRYKMDLNEWWQRNGKLQAKEMCKAVGTSYEYFKHICNKRKRPSVDLARKIVKQSGGEISLEKLLFPIEEKKK